MEPIFLGCNLPGLPDEATKQSLPASYAATDIDSYAAGGFTGLARLCSTEIFHRICTWIRNCWYSHRYPCLYWIWICSPHRLCLRNCNLIGSSTGSKTLNGNASGTDGSTTGYEATGHARTSTTDSAPGPLRLSPASPRPAFKEIKIC